MSNLGKLCYKRGGDALCYKRGGNALVFKALPAGQITIRISWTPQSYVCKKYDTVHGVALNASVAFTSGLGEIVSRRHVDGDLVATVRVTRGPATLVVSTSCTTGCADTEEDIRAQCNVFVTQPGAAPLLKLGIPLMRDETPGSMPTSTHVNVDARRKISEVI